MGRLIQFLVEHPVLLFVLAAWLFGGIGKIGKAAQRARSATAPKAGPRAGQRSAEEVAAEMRRILGMDDAEAAPERPAPVSTPAPREVVAPEPPPQPLATALPRWQPATVTTHVGEGIERRQAPASGRVGASQDLGALGGRTLAAGRVRRADASLVDLADLKRVLVMNEVLGPPLALREPYAR
ncbi:MAG: hypothetical protein JNK49_02480 [Planctomycetes bacterium]|nr:hypothetical protein [Planctomycetota bacterium]